MAKKTKENIKKRNTKDESSLDLDKEIIIGIKTLPQPEVPKKSKAKKVSSTSKTKSKKEKINPKKSKNAKKTTNSKRKKTHKTEDEEFELKLGIEDETVKNKAQKKKKTTKQQEIEKRKRQIAFRIVKYTTLVAILIGGGIYFLLSPFFNIKEVVVLGNEKITKEEIISLSAIELEENTFKIQSSQVKSNIKQNAYIEKVSVKRKLPDKIQIEIEERRPTFMLAFADAYVYLNNQGYLLEVSKDKLEVPIITGFLTPEEDIHTGNRLCSEDLQRLDHTLQIMKSAKSNDIADLITKIDIKDKQNYVLELKSEKKIVYMGDSSNLSTKMLYIVSIINENKNVEGEIFVNTDLNNKGAIFRKKV